MNDIIPRWLESLGTLLMGVAAIVGVLIPFVKVLKMRKPTGPEVVDTSVNLELAKHYKASLERFWNILILSSIFMVITLMIAGFVDFNPHVSDWEKDFFPVFFGGLSMLFMFFSVFSFLNIHFTEGKLINFLAGQKIAQDERKRWFKRRD